MEEARENYECTEFGGAMVEVEGFKHRYAIGASAGCNNYIDKYRVRQRGCSLTHSARTPPAVHQGITIWVDEIEFEKK